MSEKPAVRRRQTKLSKEVRALNQCMRVLDDLGYEECMYLSGRLMARARGLKEGAEQVEDPSEPAAVN